MSAAQSDDAYCHLWGGIGHRKFRYASVMETLAHAMSGDGDNVSAW